MGTLLPQRPLLLLWPHNQLPAPDFRNSQHPKPAMAGHATFTVMGDLEATIEEVVEGPPTELEN